MLRDYVIAEDKIMAAAIKAAGGLRVLARKLDVHPAVIEEWKRIPVARLPAIARITGLPQHVLRPDLFDVGAPQSYYGTKEVGGGITRSNSGCRFRIRPGFFRPAAARAESGSS